jgi:hypothetical protein
MLTPPFQSETSTLVIDRADRCGLFFSSLCVWHCLALPTVISSIPAFVVTEGSTIPLLQIAALSWSSLLAISAVTAGFRVHRSRGVVTMAIAGVTLQLGSAWMGPCECVSVSSVVHASDCPCRELCGWMASECQYVAMATPAVLSAFFSTAWMSPIGAILLVITHLRNWQLRKIRKLSERRVTANGGWMSSCDSLRSSGGR